MLQLTASAFFILGYRMSRHGLEWLPALTMLITLQITFWANGVIIVAGAMGTLVGTREKDTSGRDVKLLVLALLVFLLNKVDPFLVVCGGFALDWFTEEPPEILWGFVLVNVLSLFLLGDHIQATFAVTALGALLFGYWRIYTTTNAHGKIEGKKNE